MREYELKFLQDKAESMLTFLQKPLPKPADDGYEQLLIERMRNLGVMLGQASEYMAVAKYKVDTIIHGTIGDSIMKLADDDGKSPKLSASTLNMFVKAAGKDWNYCVNAFDRIHSSASKIIEAIRSLLSWEKSKMNLL